MSMIGIDFDNTIVTYDSLFHKIAKEYNYIGDDVEKTKIAVREYMNSNNMGDQFTTLQGEVYGKRILEAKPATNVLSGLELLKQKGIRFAIVSHKTMYPYKGPKYNLQQAAMSWIESNGLLGKRIGLEPNDIYFEETKEKKIQRIKDIYCTHFIDDLPEILDMIDIDLVKIQYDPNHSSSSKYIKMNDWGKLIDSIGNQ